MKKKYKLKNQKGWLEVTTIMFVWMLYVFSLLVDYLIV